MLNVIFFKKNKFVSKKGIDRRINDAASKDLLASFNINDPCGWGDEKVICKLYVLIKNCS